MTLSKQIQTLKNNWLLISVIIIVFFFSNFGVDSLGKIAPYSPEFASSTVARIGIGSDFAPEVVDRVITKTASISSEIQRGEFDEAVSKLKAIIQASDSLLLREDINLIGEDRKSYLRGSFNLKVETTKYDVVIDSIKELGEIESINENVNDVTGRYTNLGVDLEAEKARLERFKQLLSNSEKVEDNIRLTDRIFDQERSIKYLEDQIKNIDNRVDYSTIYVSLNEERSSYSDIALVKISDLVGLLVNSVNSLLSWIVYLLPWLVVGFVGYILYRKFK